MSQELKLQEKNIVLKISKQKYVFFIKQSHCNMKNIKADMKNIKAGYNKPTNLTTLSQSKSLIGH